jgi:adenylate cyclase
MKHEDESSHAGGSAGPPPTNPEIIRQHLEVILSSPSFASSERLRKLLRHLVESSLAGQASLLKEVTIGLDVFGRGPDFNPQIDSTVRVHVSKLREKLREFYFTDGRTCPLRIEIPRGSYVPVFARTEAHDPSPPAPPPRRAGKPPFLQYRMWAVALLLILGATVPAFLHYREQSRAALAANAILVLPFRDLTAKGDLGYFCDGLTEEVVSSMSRLEGIRVVPSSTSFALKGKSVDVRALASELRVGSVLEGSVRRFGTHVRVTVKIVSAPDGNPLWTQSFDREFNDIFTIQDEVAAIISKSTQQVVTRQLVKPMSYKYT